MGGPTATAWESVPPRTVFRRREWCSSEKIQQQGDFAVARAHPDGVRALGHRRSDSGFCSELRALLHSGGVFRVEDDPGVAQWDFDPDRSSDTRNGWIDFCGASQNEPGPA